MDPHIESCVARIDNNTWIIGPLVCERVDLLTQVPPGIITSWWDRAGTIAYLRYHESHEVILNGVPDSDRVDTWTHSSVVWPVGESAFCKVRAWCEDVEAEASTISMVRETFRNIPVPLVIFSWFDDRLARTYTITRRLSGSTLAEVWADMTYDQRLSVAEEIASYCAKMATITNDHFQSASGYGVVEEQFMITKNADEQPYLPRSFDPCTATELAAELGKLSTEPLPNIDALFVFYHANLRPSNIIVSNDDKKVTGILGWEAAAFYPRFWVATKPVDAVEFLLGRNDDREGLWGQMLSQALQRLGFNSELETFRRWKDAMVCGL